MEGRHSQGLTLVELLTVMSLLALLITLGIPAMNSLLESSRLRAAAEQLATSFRYARMETITHPDPAAQVYISFRHNPQENDDWCFGLARGGPCDCRIGDPVNADACRLENDASAVIRRVTSAEYPGVELQRIAFGADAHTHFDAVRGTARSGHILFGNQHPLKVILSPLGRVRLCTPGEHHLPGYPPC